jgi:ATP-dependent helicase/nuclease subunit A
VGEIERLVHGALSSAPVAAARASGRYWRELYVGVPVGERVLEGFVDLLFEGPDGLEVVDYKTDRLRSGRPRPSVDRRHRLQAAAYALAVERALQRPVRRCTLLYLTTEGARPVAVDGLARLQAQVRRGLGVPGWSRVPGSDCPPAQEVDRESS